MKNRLGKHFTKYIPFEVKINPDDVYLIDDDHIYVYDRLHRLTESKRKNKKNT